MDQEKQAIIKVDKLETSRQGQKILHQVDMNIEEQDVYFLIGPNGSGKSTLFKTLLGIYVPDNGSIRFFQQHWDGSKRKLLKKRIGALVEDPKFYTSLTVAENLKIFARYFSVPDRFIDEVLAKVALSDKKRSKVKSLSTGMKQRLGIALSLLHNPDLVFLDEPNRGLDPNQIINLRHLIQQLNTEERKTFLISTHILSEAEKMATRVGFLKNGRLIFESAVKRIRTFKKVCLTIDGFKRVHQYPGLQKYIQDTHRSHFIEEGRLWILFEGSYEVEQQQFKDLLTMPDAVIEIFPVTLEDLYRFKISSDND